MPPPRSNRFQEMKLKAAMLFVDREEPKDTFAKAIDELVADPTKPHFLTFYGVGGQGKTKLCGELVRLSGEPAYAEHKVRCAEIDLHTNRPSGDVHAWVSLRNAIAKATGARFPCFDLAYADYWSQAHPEKEPATLGQSSLASLKGDLKETVGDGLSGLAGESASGTVGEVVTELFGGVPFVGPLLKRTSKWAIAKGYEALLKANAKALENLYERDFSPDPITIAAALPDILAHELALHQRKNPDQNLLILIDEYENAMPSGGSKGVLSPDPWDRALREFVSYCHGGEYVPRNGGQSYAYKAGFLLILFGREMIRWAEIEPGWEDDLKGHQHLLEGLGSSDADDFLVQAGVAEPALREAIVAAATAPDPASGKSTAYPIMLDLAVQIYFDTRSTGRDPAVDDFSLKSKSYVDRRRELFARFMRNYGDVTGLEPLLRRLACAREFTRETARFLIETFATPFDLLHFSDLTELSFVTRAQDGKAWVIHNHIRVTLLESLVAEDRRETHQALAEWYTQRGTPAHSSEMTLEHAEALGEALVHYAELGMARPDEFWTGTCQSIGAWTTATPILLEPEQFALSLLATALPPDHPDLANSLNDLALLQLALRDFDAARLLLENAHAILRKALPSDHPDIAASLGNRALLHANLRDFDAARPLYEEALAILRKALPPDHPEIATSLNNLANVHLDSLDFDSARPLFEEALTINRKALPTDHPDLAHSINDLANLHYDLRDFDAARSLYEESLAIRRRALPSDHPVIASSLNNLANLYVSSRDFDNARLLYEEALMIRRKSQPPDHPDIAASLNHLGLLHAKLRDFDSARPFHEEALAIHRKSQPPDHPDIASSLTHLALLDARTLDFDSALPLLEEALAIRRKALPHNHPDLAASLNHLGLLHADLSDFNAARPLLEEALAIYRKVLPPDYLDLASSLNILALLHADLHDFDAARPLHEEALAIYRKALPPDHPDLASGLNHLGLLHSNLRDFDAARPLLEEALAIRRKALPPDHPEIASSLNDLAILHASLRDFDTAGLLYEEALAIRRKALPPDHPDLVHSLNNLAALDVVGPFSLPNLKDALQLTNVNRQVQPDGSPDRPDALHPPASRNALCPCGSNKRYKHCHGAMEGTDNAQ